MNLQGLELRNAGAIRELKLSSFSPGLNVIIGGNGTGKTTLRKFVTHILSGRSTPIAGARGSLTVTQAGRVFRADREQGRLRLSADDAGVTETSTWLDAVDPELYQSLFDFDTTRLTESARQITHALTSGLNVPVGDLAWGNESEYRARRESISQIESQLAALKSRAVEWESRHRRLREQIEQAQSAFHRREELSREIASIEARLEHSDRFALEQQVHELDGQLAELRARLEKAEWESRQTVTTEQPHYALGLYDHLDTVERHLTQLHGLLDVVQSRRVALKSDIEHWGQMSLESEQHPYHEVRSIVQQLNDRLFRLHGAINSALGAENLSDSAAITLRQDAVPTVEDARQDLQRLCRELGERFVQIRHRAAAEELRELRRIHDQVEEDIRAALERRRWLIDQLHQYDSMGADEIQRRQRDWMTLARDHGHAEARRQRLGELPPATVTQQRTANTDLPLLQRRVSALEAQRSQYVARLVEMENDLAPLRQRLEVLKNERSQLFDVDVAQWERELAHVDANLQGVRGEIAELESRLAAQQHIQRIPPNAIIVAASDYARRLTCGEVTRIILRRHTDQSTMPEATVRHGERVQFDALGSSTQQQILLALALAAVESLVTSGRRAPMLLDDVWVNLDRNRIRATCDVLCDVAGRGVQIVALTAETAVMEFLRERGVVIMDLPETGVTDRPWTSPERLPDWTAPTRTQGTSPATVSVRSELSWNHPTWGAFEPSSTGTIESSPTQSSRILASSTDERMPPDREAELRPTCSEETRFRELSFIPGSAIEWLEASGLHTVSDLLDADSTSWSEDWQGSPVSASDVNRWQALAWLMICVPGLRADEAALMFDAGITEPEQLDGLTAQSLIERLRRYHRSGTRRDALSRIDLDRSQHWLNGMRQTRSKWYSQGGYSRRRRGRRRASRRSWNRTDRAHEPRERRRYESDRSRDGRDGRAVVSSETNERSRDERPRIARLNENEHTEAHGRPERSQTSNASHSDKRSQEETEVLKFYLDLDDHIEAAPSIGPKTADRFEKIGVSTVRQLLQHTAESLAEKINYKRITAKTILQWQQQARLVCRVPNLRGHDAQILVACGITDAEDLANMSPEALFQIVEPFSDTKEGLRIIRSGKKPDLEEVTDWIRWAGQTRSLQAA